MNPVLATARWKNRQLRHQLYLLPARYRLATADFATGLGASAWLLHGLVRSLHPAVCVEIGSASGWSTCHIGLALKENFAGRLYAIDPHGPTAWNDRGPADTYPVLQRNLRRCGVENFVEILRVTSEAAARGWTRPIDFLFIDGDHSYEGARRDWERFAPFLAPLGVAVFHDSTWELHGPNRPDMGVPRLVEELRRAGLPVVTIDRDCGLSLIQKTPGGVPLLPPNP
ncbi:MAG TPA: class I SAM-dependent methyltransferase [Opitutaceae bacterium]|nr:class I SAM-dependent methyltransferase [Opitutaceae bacterium]